MRQTIHYIVRSITQACALFIVIALMALLPSTALAAQMDKTLASGAVRIHYPATAPSSCDAILLGVGTAMGADAYDKLSSEIIKHGYIVVILDHQPGNLTKTDEGKFAQLAGDVKSNLLTWLSSSNCNTINHWVMGGHSAGGQAAQNAVAHNAGLADAVFSIDPYDASKTDPVYVPAMYWGFTTTTCFVDVNAASKKAYYQSNAKRAFYKVAKQYSWGPCGYSPKYFHCSFCDSHCPACTNCSNTPDSFFTDVGKSVNKFIKAAFYGNWSKSALSFGSTTPLTLYVDGDRP